MMFNRSGEGRRRVLPRSERREVIRELIERNRIDTQQQLADLLLADGVLITQATLSRDLRSLGAVKGPEGYVLEPEPEPIELSRPVRDMLRQELVDIRQAGNLAVLSTTSGTAADLGAMIRGAGLPGVVGCVGQESNVLVVLETQRKAARFVSMMRRLHKRTAERAGR